MSNPCNFCKSKDVIGLFAKDGYPIVRCSSCGLIYTDIRIGEDFFAEYYNENYYLGGNRIGYSNYLLNADTFRKNCCLWLREIMKYKTEGRLLDVGCGPGFFLNIAREKGWDVSGIEVSGFASRYARSTFGLDIINSDFLNAALAPDCFDVITMWDAIEHLPDPSAAISRVYNSLKSKGIFAFLTGDIKSPLSRLMGSRWRLMTPPLHLYFFSVDTLSPALRKHGFKILNILRPGKFVSLDLFFYQLLNLYFPDSRSRARLMPDRINLNKINFYINLKDEILVICEKP